MFFSLVMLLILFLVVVIVVVFRGGRKESICWKKCVITLIWWNGTISD
jgi:hypothetical protein